MIKKLFEVRTVYYQSEGEVRARQIGTPDPCDRLSNFLSYNTQQRPVPRLYEESFPRLMGTRNGRGVMKQEFWLKIEIIIEGVQP